MFKNMCIWRHKLCNSKTGVGPTFTWSNERWSSYMKRVCDKVGLLQRFIFVYLDYAVVLESFRMIPKRKCVVWVEGPRAFVTTCMFSQMLESDNDNEWIAVCTNEWCYTYILLKDKKTKGQKDKKNKRTKGSKDQRTKGKKDKRGKVLAFLIHIW